MPCTVTEQAGYATEELFSEARRRLTISVRHLFTFLGLVVAPELSYKGKIHARWPSSIDAFFFSTFLPFLAALNSQRNRLRRSGPLLQGGPVGGSLWRRVETALRHVI